MSDFKAFDSQSSAATSDPFRVLGNELFVISGTFDTASLDLEVQNPDGNWVAVDGHSYTTTGAHKADMHRLRGDHKYRWNLSSVGASTSLTVWVLEGAN